ncbi:MAG: bifunctional acetaldehyde-CoA/alcohol dehydrogenase, partial [Oscillospiraceae bacterium]|nr:bifunctional acetaldehyde-CoA/alcohol dehydrogenase [Oscillospiraceae bacterium]
MKREYPFIDTVDKLQEEIDRVKKAQAVYAGFTQEQVDRIFLAAATAANKARIPLAKAAVAETGMGIV